MSANQFFVPARIARQLGLSGRVRNGKERSALVLLVALGSDAQAHNPSSDMALEPFVHDGHIEGAWTTAGLVREDAFAWLEVCGAASPASRTRR